MTSAANGDEKTLKVPLDVFLKFLCQLYSLEKNSQKKVQDKSILFRKLLALGVAHLQIKCCIVGRQLLMKTSFVKKS